jgi:hypothetical protein
VLKINKKSNLEGQKFNRLLVLRKVDVGKSMTYYECLCDCGNLHIANGAAVKKGNIKSCGCLQREIASKNSKTHGFSKTRLYRVWRGMITRCENPNSDYYYSYGGRGIKVCPEWRHDFLSFRKWSLSNGYDENAKFSECTLDRIDNDGDYEPSNCRWVSMKEQSKNRRVTVFVEIESVYKPLVDLSEEFGVNYGTLRSRIARGVKTKEELLAPPKDIRHTTSKYITFNGVTLDQAGWARKIGITPTSLSRRLKNPNWTLEMALTTPPISKENTYKYRKDRLK